MKHKLAIFILFSLICRLAYAQTIIIEGVVTDAQNHQAVPFATLGIKGKNIGTVADENGIFNFAINAGLADEPLIVSAVGYSPGSIIIGKFKQGKQEISLIQTAITLNTVVIKPDKFKTMIFGRTGNSTMMVANMLIERDLVNDNLGKELASIIPIDKHSYLRDFNVHVVFNHFQSVKFRLNFYSVKDGQPDQPIVNKNILFDVTQRNGWLKVDLTKYNIYLEGYKEIAVAIQWVKSVKMDTVAKAAFGVSVIPIPFHAMYFRYKSQAEWKKIAPAYVAFNIIADSFKPNKEKDNQEDDKQADETPVLSDSVKILAAVEESFQEAEASGYGNNSTLGKYIHLPDANIYYEVYGSGEPLLLLHGNGASMATFYKQIAEFAKSYRVIAVDTRAQGKSTDASTTPLTYEKFAEDMKLLLDSLNIKQANVVGWSDGGNTGLIMAIKYPAYVHKLVTVGAVLSPDGVEPEVLKMLQNSFKKIIASSQTKTTHERLVTLLVHEPHISDNDLKQIQAPVLVVAGDKDIVVHDHTQEIAANIKYSKLLIIDGATHYAPWEKTGEFNQAVLDFFKE
jgi:pimeloyl-ACP methyl ester carboxylesterase